MYLYTVHVYKHYTLHYIHVHVYCTVFIHVHIHVYMQIYTYAFVFTNLLSSLVILQGPESTKALLKCYINKMNEYTCVHVTWIYMYRYMYMCTINVVTLIYKIDCTHSLIFQKSDPIRYHCLVYNMINICTTLLWALLFIVCFLIMRYIQSTLVMGTCAIPDFIKFTYY